MKSTVSLFFIAGCMFFTGCAGSSLVPVPNTPLVEWPAITVLGAEPTQAITPNITNDAMNPNDPETPIPYTVLFESDISPAMYEPTDGCYLAAWCDPTDKAIDGPAAFNRQTGKAHAVFTYEMYLGEDFPENWLLRCIAAQATPMFIIHPSGDNAVFSTAMLTQTAQWLGVYQIPMFVAFFPLVGNNTYDASTYTLYYRYARALFQENAPKAAFVWLTDSTTSATFYPGDEAVDWVGLSLIHPYTENGYETDKLMALDTFNERFQFQKPMMLLPFAVGHFSTCDYVYHTQEAAEELAHVYNMVTDLYPRVKLIAYGDFIEAEGDDFTVTRDDLLLETYQASINQKHYLSHLEENESRRTNSLRSTYEAYYVDGRMLIDLRVFSKEMQIKQPSGTDWVEDVRCVDANTLNEKDVFVVINHEQRFINIYKKTT